MLLIAILLGSVQFGDGQDPVALCKPLTQLY